MKKRKGKSYPVRINVAWTTAKYICNHNDCNTPIFDHYKYCTGCGREIDRNDYHE